MILIDFYKMDEVLEYLWLRNKLLFLRHANNTVPDTVV